MVKDDGARGAEITVEDGELPYCPDCQVKHAIDLKAHIDPDEKEKYEKAQWLVDKVISQVGMSKTQTKDYETIRELEHKFEDGLTVLRDLRHKVQATPGIDNPVAGNPRGRDFLPHGLTVCEKAHPAVQKKLKSCIKQAEIKCCGKHTTDYASCSCNPVAVCRASEPCP